MLILKSTHITPSIKRDIYSNGCKLLHLTCILIIIVFVLGLWESQAQGALSTSLAGQHSTRSHDPWAVFSNPAGLPAGKWVFLGVQRNFGISELNEAGISIGYPLHKSFTHSLAIASYGWEKMRFIHLSHGFRYSQERFNLGLAHQTVGMFVPSPYRSDWVIQLNGGAQYKLSDELLFGFYIHNLSQSKWRNSSDLIEQNINSGVSWKALPTIQLHLQYAISDHYKDDTILAIQWNLTDDFTLGFGAGTQPRRLSLGFNLQRGSNHIGWMATNYSRISKAWIQAAEIGVLR
jgi:hypothetical protein